MDYLNLFFRRLGCEIQVHEKNSQALRSGACWIFYIGTGRMVRTKNEDSISKSNSKLKNLPATSWLFMCPLRYGTFPMFQMYKILAVLHKWIMMSRQIAPKLQFILQFGQIYWSSLPHGLSISQASLSVDSVYFAQLSTLHVHSE